MSIHLKYTHKKTGKVFYSSFDTEHPGLFRQRLKEMQREMRKGSACDVCEVSERTMHNANPPKRSAT